MSRCRFRVAGALAVLRGLALCMVGPPHKILSAHRAETFSRAWSEPFGEAYCVFFLRARKASRWAELRVVRRASGGLGEGRDDPGVQDIEGAGAVGLAVRWRRYVKSEGANLPQGPSIARPLRIILRAVKALSTAALRSARGRRAWLRREARCLPRVPSRPAAYHPSPTLRSGPRSHTESGRRPARTVPPRRGRAWRRAEQVMRGRVDPRSSLPAFAGTSFARIASWGRRFGAERWCSSGPDMSGEKPGFPSYAR